REFDERVNRLARLLISQGVGPESLVGLAIRRSLDLVVGMYAIVTAGGAYVPLDPDHPAERIAHILDTADPVCVRSTTADADAAPPPTPSPPPARPGGRREWRSRTAPSTTRAAGCSRSTRWVRGMCTCRRRRPPSTSRCGATSCRCAPARSWWWPPTTATAIRPTSPKPSPPSRSRSPTSCRPC